MQATIDISTKAIVRRLLFVVALLAIATLAYNLQGVIRMFIIAFFIALVMHGPTTKLQQYVIAQNRKLAAIVAFMSIGFVVSVVIALVIPVISNQARELALQAPGYFHDLSSGDGFISTWMQNLDIVGSFQDFLASIASGLTLSVDLIIDVAARVLDNIITFLFTIVLAFLMVVEGPNWAKQSKKFIPKSASPALTELMPKMYKAVTGFVAGQIIVTSIAATATLILLFIFGVPAPLSLAAVIWVTGLIPLIGNTLGAVIVVAVALSQSVFVAIFLGVYYIIYQQIENNVFEPIVQSRTVSLTPLYVIISAVIGVFAAGFIGALIAIPVGACVKIVAEHFLNESLDPDKSST